MGRVFVMGDIHGAAKAMKQVFERAQFDKKHDTLIQIGDVVDGWDETPECVDLLMACNDLIAVRGNHDIWAHDWLKYGIRHHMWERQGGKATIDAYIAEVNKEDSTGDEMERHLPFFDKQVDWYIDEENRLFIHGGWNYHAGFPAGAKTLLTMAGSLARECHWDRDLLMGARSGKHNGFTPLKAFKEIYIGHTATEDSEVENILNLWNVDTGAGWSGKLTMMDINTKEIFQSDCVLDLYDHKGRR